MEPVEVIYCIICEDTRFERFNKVSFLGFYGITPYVEIKLKEIGKPLEKTVFVFGLNKSEGVHQLKFNLLDPSDSLFHEIKMPDLDLSGTGLTVTVVGFGGLIFKVEGEYKVQLFECDKMIYNSSFKVSIADPKLFE